MDKRIVFTASGLQVRESGGEGKESRVIEGCAIVFDKETVLYESTGYRECEVIARSCISEDWLKTQDIKMNLLHDRHSSIARSKMGEGSLKMEVREDGLYFSFEAPECDLGNRALALVKNGTYTGCSFEFYSKDYEIEEREKGDYLVTHREFAKLTALTIAMDPAYEQTSVNAREEYENGKRKTENGKLTDPTLYGREKETGTAEEEEKTRARAVREMKARLYMTEV